MLVSDIGMPDADGFDLLAQIRAHASPDAANLPALALTAFAQPQDRQRALASGFQAWVSKPLDPAELLAAVAQLAASRVSTGAREQGRNIRP
ncbi:Virulence transcriptional regulatory protein PhoP [compost metagenome]